MLCLPEQPRHTDPAASACFRRTKAPCSLIRPIRSPKIRTAALSIALKALFAARQKTPLQQIALGSAGAIADKHSPTAHGPG